MIGIAIILLLLLLYFKYVPYRRVRHGNYVYNMAQFHNSSDATKRLGKINDDIIKFLKHLRDKYNVDNNATEIDDRYTMIDHMLNNYNPEVIYETNPLYTSDTSYMINKGARFHVCLRQKYKPNTFVDENTMMFVYLHELSHIAAYDVVGHPTRFWEVFKFVLEEAVDFGIYTPVDYSVDRVDYCGLEINYSPLFDNNLNML